MQQRLAHLEVGDQRIVGAEHDAVVYAPRRHGMDHEAFRLHLLLVIGLDLADHLGLAGQEGADAHAVLGRHHVLDAVEIGAALVRHLHRTPVVILARLHHELAAERLALHHERARADDLGGVAQRLVRQRERPGRYQPRADHRCALQEADRGLGEGELHGQRIDHFAGLVVGDHLRDRVLQLLVAEAVGVVVLRDRRGIERRAVGEGDAGPDLEGVLGGVGVDRPALGDPRLDLERLGILIRELVGDLVEHAAVGIEAAGRRIEIGVGLLIEIDQRAAFDRCVLRQRGAGERERSDGGKSGKSGQRHG